MHNKTLLRDYLKKKRLSINSQRKEEAQKHAFRALSPLCQHVQYVLSYISFNSELALTKLNENLLKHQKLILPAVVEDQLTLYQVKSFADLKRHAWGFLEPDPQKCQEFNKDLIDLVILPGLGFDLNTMGRLGYGKGHFDRLLKKMPSSHYCGIGYKEQQFFGIPVEFHDITLHRIYLF